MAFTVTVLDRFTSGGKFYEKGTFVNDGGSTGGTITPQQTGNGLSAGIREIYDSMFGASGAAIAESYSNGRQTVTITTPANATGIYMLSGYGA